MSKKNLLEVIDELNLPELNKKEKTEHNGGFMGLFDKDVHDGGIFRNMLSFNTWSGALLLGFGATIAAIRMWNLREMPVQSETPHPAFKHTIFKNVINEHGERVMQKAEAVDHQAMLPGVSLSESMPEPWFKTYITKDMKPIGLWDKIRSIVDSALSFFWRPTTGIIVISNFVPDVLYRIQVGNVKLISTDTRDASPYIKGIKGDLH